MKTFQKIKNTGSRLRNSVSDNMSPLLGLLSSEALLKWTESISKSTATIYDKAMDADYLRSHIGGGNHRMFDGNHDLVGAWQTIRDAAPGDTFVQDAVGYADAIWKDVTTTKGLPFFTWNKENYEVTAQWVADNIPFATKSWFYDLNSLDIGEIAGASVSGVAAVLMLKKADKERLSELIGSMGFYGVYAANPLGLIVAIAVFAIGYRKALIRHQSITEGTALAAVSAVVFSLPAGIPVIILFILSIVINNLIRKHVFNSSELRDMFKDSWEKDYSSGWVDKVKIPFMPKKEAWS
jgi:hypothetical protein